MTWITAEVGTPRTDDQAGTVCVLVGEDINQPGAVVWEGDWRGVGQLARSLWQARCRTLPPSPTPIGRYAQGDVRQALDATQVMAVRTYTGQWKLLGPDPEPWLYGWRSDADVRDWQPLGNVAALQPTRDEDRDTEPAPDAQASIFDVLDEEVPA